ncbi:monocopper oxidase-like protein SKS1 isoform X2 [Punica granatum]|uniref:Monocopper oxidase-like protein SKS1 isoform X2 n=1 Tax=Punica granatum TaxID=22663 RepID=A0A6P8CKP1_PUNGR|nr:monocopper oxidase-like protein SKS1 isoform X2 [Punica granatum]
MAALLRLPVFYVIHIALLSSLSLAADPYVFYDFKLTYITASPLGVAQQVIAVNGKFPGPLLNATTNYNVVVNVHNDLDEPLLLTWPGIEMRKDSWQDGVLGTNCPIPSKWNWTYEFQPDGDITLIIGDWYTRNHTALRAALDAGKDLGMPDGVLINGRGPFRYNTSLVPDGIAYETVNVEPGKTYRFRVHNVGTSTSLNFRIQNHNLLLVETEGHYTVQQNYTCLDIHIGQSYSFLVTMDQNASSDYYIAASARFVNESLWQRVTGVAILHYSNSKGPASGPLPDPPNDVYDKTLSMNQAKSIRLNVTASGARPNPQGSFHYGSINVTDTYLLKTVPPLRIGGKLRATLNGISFQNLTTPVRLADQHKVKGVYKLDFPSKPLDRPPKTDISLINGTYKGFIEVVFQNNDTIMQSFHVDGYSCFLVGMDYGDWTENSRGSYNRWDAISRATIQVYPGAWTAIFISLDNPGVWNIRAENLDRWYLGQETYMRIVNPEENGKTEMTPPDNVLYCGALEELQKPQKHSSASPLIPGKRRLFLTVLTALLASSLVFC